MLNRCTFGFGAIRNVRDLFKRRISPKQVANTNDIGQCALRMRSATKKLPFIAVVDHEQNWAFLSENVGAHEDAKVFCIECRHDA
jgi:hypothetical protein